MPKTPAPQPYENTHVKPNGLQDKIALRTVKFLRWFADAYFAKRYGHRAVVIETVAAVPGMVGGMLQHFKALRLMRDDRGWIKTLLDEAENERMHLMTFIQIAQPNWFERLMVILAQVSFIMFYTPVYIFFPRMAHRMVGYLEEEAVESYTQYLAQIDAGEAENVPAPQLAIDYWNLSKNATLRDVVTVVRDDEAGHRDVNHGFANELKKS